MTMDISPRDIKKEPIQSTESVPIAGSKKSDPLEKKDYSPADYLPALLEIIGYLLKQHQQDSKNKLALTNMKATVTSSIAKEIKAGAQQDAYQKRLQATSSFAEAGSSIAQMGIDASEATMMSKDKGIQENSEHAASLNETLIKGTGLEEGTASDEDTKLFKKFTQKILSDREFANKAEEGYFKLNDQGQIEKCGQATEGARSFNDMIKGSSPTAREDAIRQINSRIDTLESKSTNAQRARSRKMDVARRTLEAVTHMSKATINLLSAESDVKKGDIEAKRAILQSIQNSLDTNQRTTETSQASDKEGIKNVSQLMGQLANRG